MAPPEWSSVLELYQHVVCSGVVQNLEKQTGPRRKRGIYRIVYRSIRAQPRRLEPEAVNLAAGVFDRVDVQPTDTQAGMRCKIQPTT